MSAELIQEAIKGLAVQGVYLRASRFTQAPDFDPTVPQALEITAQYKAGAEAMHLVDIEDAESGTKQTLMNVHFSCGLRLIEADRIKKAKSEIGVAAEIMATFVAQYLVLPDNHPRKEALDAFAMNNAGYHVWPYWREYAQSVCTRAGLPVIAIPMFTLPKKSQPKQTKPEKKVGKPKAPSKQKKTAETE
jgi:hypothetical protein